MSGGGSGPATVIFVHIPKTAGRTLEAVLARQYRPAETLGIYGYDGGIQAAVSQLESMGEEARRSLRLIKGHYRFGLHELLPQPARYLTMLRDPIERVISHYAYMRETPRHPLHELARREGLAGYVESGTSRELDNGQVRLVSGWEKGYGFGECPPQMLDEAQRNIERSFAAVGVVELFDLSLVLMKRALGWGDIRYELRNVTRRRPRREDFPGAELAVVEARNALDLELYRWARSRLEREFERPEVAEAVAEFGRRNRRFQRTRRWMGPTLERTRRLRARIQRLVG